jgi:hypothetical protein
VFQVPPKGQCGCSTMVGGGIEGLRALGKKGTEVSEACGNPGHPESSGNQEGSELSRNGHCLKCTIPLGQVWRHML